MQTMICTRCWYRETSGYLTAATINGSYCSKCGLPMKILTPQIRNQEERAALLRRTEAEAARAALSPAPGQNEGDA